MPAEYVVDKIIRFHLRATSSEELNIKLLCFNMTPEVQLLKCVNDITSKLYTFHYYKMLI